MKSQLKIPVHVFLKEQGISLSSRLTGVTLDNNEIIFEFVEPGPEESYLYIGKHVLHYKDCININEPHIHQIFEYIRFIVRNWRDGEPGYVELINECDACGYGIEDKSNDYMKNPSDIWVFSIVEEDDEEGFGDYNEDWKRIMGDHYDCAGEDVSIFRCRNCGKWGVDIN